MSVKWRTKISVLDTKRRNVSVTLEQVDDADLKNIRVLKSFSVLDALIDTPERKQQVIGELERQYHVEKQKAKDNASIVGTLSDSIKTAAEGWEAK